MNKDMTLVIMAAGMGSRFGGLKQIEPVGPNNEFIIDYSIYDAIEAGFNHVIIIIRKENLSIFKETIGVRIENKIKVTYVFQETYMIPSKYDSFSSRVKPWGTGHAILCAKDYIDGPFLVINSDDFYGRDAFIKAYNFMLLNNNEYGIVTFKVVNTLSEYGAVKRGVCRVNESYLESIVECSVIKEDNVITASPLDKSLSFILSDDAYVNVNMFCLTGDFLDVLDTEFNNFLEENKNDILQCEYFLPSIIVKSNKKIKVIETSSSWMGITYKEDKNEVVSRINLMVENKIYPKKLY
ncbi:MAG: sugar phosphate nucleotidyltransferase [Bacilli bacterium]